MSIKRLGSIVMSVVGLAALTGGLASAQSADPGVATAALHDANGAAAGTVTWTQVMAS